MSGAQKGMQLPNAAPTTMTHHGRLVPSPAPPGMAVATFVCLPDRRSLRIMVVVAPSLLFSVTLQAVHVG